jgi:hypothetical protein
MWERIGKSVWSEGVDLKEWEAQVLCREAESKRRERAGGG